MASKSAQTEPEKAEVIEEALDTLETTLDRVKVLYEQYFLGIQKQPPTFIHSDVERKIRDVAQLQIRNTALRYRFVTLQQKFGAYNSYWRRTLRQIENGTYARSLQKVGRQAAKTGAEIPEEILAAMPKRMRDQIRRDREAALAIAARRGSGLEGDDVDVDLLSLEDEDVDAAAFIKEPTDLRRKLLKSGGAHVVSEEDADFDLDAFFASVTSESDAAAAAATSARATPAPPAPTPAAPSAPAPLRAASLGGARPSSPTLPPRPVVNVRPGQPTPVAGTPRPDPGPSNKLPTGPVVQPADVRKPTGPVVQPADVRKPATPVVPPENIRPASGPMITFRPGQPTPPSGVPRPNLGQRPESGPSVSGPNLGRPDARPGQPTPPGGTRTRQVTPLSAFPAIPKPAPPAATPRADSRHTVAPSQVTRPIPIIAGASTARPAVPVETMAGPFPRTPAGPRQRPPERVEPTVAKPASQPVEPAAVRPVQKPAARPPPGMTDADVNALYAKYVKAKEAVGQSPSPGSYGKLLETINQQAPKIMEQYKSKGVDFSVVVKDNQVIIRAKPKL